MTEHDTIRLCNKKVGQFLPHSFRPEEPVDEGGRFAADWCFCEDAFVTERILQVEFLEVVHFRL